MIKTELFKKAVDNTVSDSVRSKYNIIRSGIITSVTADNKYCSILFDNTSDRVDNVKIPSYFGDVRVGSECAVVSYDPNYTSKVFLIYVGEFRQASLVTNINQNWLSWTPTWTGISIYDGRVTAKYLQIGSLVNYRLSVVFGTSTSLVTAVRFTLPVNSQTYSGTATTQPIGRGKIYDVSAGSVIYCSAIWATTTQARIDVDGAGFGSADLQQGYALGTSFPFLWANTDEIFVQGFYESA